MPQTESNPFAVRDLEPDFSYGFGIQSMELAEPPDGSYFVSQCSINSHADGSMDFSGGFV